MRPLPTQVVAVEAGRVGAAKAAAAAAGIDAGFFAVHRDADGAAAVGVLEEILPGGDPLAVKFHVAYAPGVAGHDGDAGAAVGVISNPLQFAEKLSAGNRSSGAASPQGN